MEIPARFLPTQTLAPETFLVRQALGEGLGPVVAPINTMVIRGAEPVIVDTGMSITRDRWLEETFAIVDPADVRWVFLSHDDVDHVGALYEVLDACPQAKVVSNMFSVLRMSAERLLPLDRLHILNPGESLDVGDRQLTAIVPPTFDSPTTRGLFDPTTGVYWAGDSFAVEVSRVVDDIDELGAEELREGFLQTQRMVSPWHTMLDPAAYSRHLDTLRSVHPTVAVGCHGPAFHGARLAESFSLFEELPHLPPAPLVNQTELEMLLSILAAPAA